MPVGEICNRTVVIAERGNSIEQAAGLMREHHVGDVVVVDERNSRRIPVGVLTDRDIVVEVLAKGIDPRAVSVGDIMSLDLVTASEGDDFVDTIEAMRAKRVRRVPVVGQNGGLVGILAADDMIDPLAETLTDIAKLVHRERKVEESKRR